jgi:hypothetical protein
MQFGLFEVPVERGLVTRRKIERRRSASQSDVEY